MNAGRDFKNTTMRKTCGPKMGESNMDREDCTMKSFITWGS
jgi:hypothetical protein